MTTSAPARLTVQLPGLSVGALTWGPTDGPLALLVHGFPDTAWSWRHVGAALAADGRRVVAPFSRGYAPTGIPADGRYQVGALVRDVVGLHEALGGDERAVLIGHDWGAMTAYGAAVFAPERFGRVVAMSVPPYATLRRVFRGRRALALGLRQARCSWYMLANQFPGGSERAFPALVGKLWHDWSPGFDAAEDVAHVLTALPDGAHRTAALRYYRAMAQPWRRRREFAAEQRASFHLPAQPTLYLHGDRDGCLLPEVGAQVGPDLAPGGRAVLVPGGGHFLQVDQPERVIREIRDFLGPDGVAG